MDEQTPSPAAPPAEQTTNAPDYTKFHAPPVSLDTALAEQSKAANDEKPAFKQEAKSADAKGAQGEAKQGGEQPDTTDYKSEYEKAQERLAYLERYAPAVERLEKDGYKDGDGFIREIDGLTSQQAQQKAVQEATTRALQPLYNRLYHEVNTTQTKSDEDAIAEYNAAYAEREKLENDRYGVQTERQAIEQERETVQEQQFTRDYWQAVDAHETIKNDENAQVMVTLAARDPYFTGKMGEAAQFVADYKKSVGEQAVKAAEQGLREKWAAEYEAQRNRPRAPAPAGGGSAPAPFGAQNNAWEHATLDDLMERR